jgi:hypothetical protein
LDTGQYKEIYEKSIVKLYIWLKRKKNRLRLQIARPWMPIRLRIGKNDVDPTGSGSTTLDFTMQMLPGSDPGKRTLDMHHYKQIRIHSTELLCTGGLRM